MKTNRVITVRPFPQTRQTTKRIEEECNSAGRANKEMYMLKSSPSLRKGMTVKIFISSIIMNVH